MFKGIIKTKETRLVFVGNGSVFRDPLFLDADKTIECGYQPLCIGGDYWNKGD